MDKEKFFEEITEAVRKEIRKVPEDLQVETGEVVKTNDQKLHGISLRRPGQEAAPTLYLEDCLREYENGRPLQQIAEAVAEALRGALQKAPQTADISLEYQDIEEKLVFQVAEAERNRERLKDLVYRPAENGFVKVAYVMVEEDRSGNLCFAVTKRMAEDFGYDVERLLDRADANMQQRYRPVLTEMTDVFMGRSCAEGGIDPLTEDFGKAADGMMYVLTNESSINGAGALFYPDVQTRIGEILGSSYYVLPSSRHEVIITPERNAPGVRELQALVRDVNRTMVEPRDILSDRVFLFDREKNRLMEPAAMERRVDERSSR